MAISESSAATKAGTTTSQLVPGCVYKWYPKQQVAEQDQPTLVAQYFGDTFGVPIWRARHKPSLHSQMTLFSSEIKMDEYFLVKTEDLLEAEQALLDLDSVHYLYCKLLHAYSVSYGKEVTGYLSTPGIQYLQEFGQFGMVAGIQGNHVELKVVNVSDTESFIDYRIASPSRALLTIEQLKVKLVRPGVQVREESDKKLQVCVTGSAQVSKTSLLLDIFKDVKVQGYLVQGVFFPESSRVQ